MNRLSIRAAVFSVGVALYSVAPSALAQQMDHSNMPGMNMPGSSGQSGRAPAAAPRAQQGGTGGSASSGTAAANNTATSAASAGGDRNVASRTRAQTRAARPDRN